MINAFISHVHEESAIARQVRLLLKECFAEQIEVFLALNQAYSEREKFEERRKPPAFSGVC